METSQTGWKQSYIDVWGNTLPTPQMAQCSIRSIPTWKAIVIESNVM